MSKNLFVSYARQDVEFAQQLSTDLQQKGVPVWIDQLSIRSGEDWPDIIAKAIEECQAMLVILSPHSIKSTWVIRELAFADQKGKPVLPLLYKPYKPNSLPRSFLLRFGNIQIADFSEGDYKSNLEELLESIKNVLGIELRTPQPRSLYEIYCEAWQVALYLDEIGMEREWDSRQFHDQDLADEESSLEERWGKLMNEGELVGLNLPDDPILFYRKNRPPGSREEFQKWFFAPKE
jgi:hypothetical protein